jgi:hypothetical protein
MNFQVRVWCIALMFVPSTVAAQDTGRGSRQAGAAVEWSSLVEGWGGSASFRIWRGRLGLDVGAAAWAAERRREFPSTDGTAIIDHTSDSARSAGVSVVGRAGTGRLSLIAGAGPALFTKTTSTRTTFDGVVRSNTRHTSSGMGARFLLEAEAELAGGVSAFAGARVELPDLRVPGLSSGALSTGLRVKF